jgi:hypothetical protein
MFVDVKNNFFKIKKYYLNVFPNKKHRILNHLKDTHILNFFFYMTTSPLRFDERTILLIKKIRFKLNKKKKGTNLLLLIKKFRIVFNSLA